MLWRTRVCNGRGGQRHLHRQRLVYRTFKAKVSQRQNSNQESRRDRSSAIVGRFKAFATRQWNLNQRSIFLNTIASENSVGRADISSGGALQTRSVPDSRV